MGFLSRPPEVSFQKPLFCSILGNTLLSTVPGVSGAGPSPEKTLFTPILDAELIMNGEITSFPIKPNTPTGCPTPATITRAMMDLIAMQPLFINAGLLHKPTVPCLDMYGEVGEDPRTAYAVRNSVDLYQKGRILGKFLNQQSDLLVLGECVPGGTTTALCVLRSLGYNASVSSSFVNNPIGQKDEIANIALSRILADSVSSPLDIVKYTGDPMMPVAVGIAESYHGELLLAGGTQMLAVAALIKGMRGKLPKVVTTKYVQDDASANVDKIAEEVGVSIFYVDPDFGSLGHKGLARYCIGEVKEGMGAGGAMCLAYLLGHSPDAIRKKILSTANSYG
jgi:uncharacterized protein (TIGR00303 family)